MPGFEEFPNLHPLIVHFPVVLLILALGFEVAAWLKYSNRLDKINLLILSGGFLTAILAGTLIHPHAHNLNERATRVLKNHDLFADLTIWISMLAAVTKAWQVFWAGPSSRSLRLLAFGLVLAASVAVSITGHYGAALVHIEGVGPKGQMLEDREHSH